ncbi:MAG: ketopantoate reductase family protein [Lachnospiraceae bacterium]|jgi:2-dehydropantoate 2-reductase|nr:ketopantoate reductase family protein [Lachnospiraceae bacterium]
MNQLKYMVIGAGGTGGGIGGFLSKAGKDVTMIARGTHLLAMCKGGLHVESLHGSYMVPVRACAMEEYGSQPSYTQSPDVIFVCVKGYSLDGIVPFIRRISKKGTIVIPILNIYGTGKKLQKELPELTVTDGCIYIASEIKEPGTILMSGDIFRVVYGFRKGTPLEIQNTARPLLETVRQDLEEADILPIFSEEVERDTLKKFSFVSPMAAVGAACDVPAQAMQEGGQFRSLFVSLVREIKTISAAMGICLPDDIVEINLKIMDDLIPTATASMQRDIKKGGQSEVDGLVYEVVRLGDAYHVPVPEYKRLSEVLKTKLL